MAIWKFSGVDFGRMWTHCCRHAKSEGIECYFTMSFMRRCGRAWNRHLEWRDTHGQWIEYRNISVHRRAGKQVHFDNFIFIVIYYSPSHLRMHLSYFQVRRSDVSTKICPECLGRINKFSRFREKSAAKNFDRAQARLERRFSMRMSDRALAMNVNDVSIHHVKLHPVKRVSVFPMKGTSFMKIHEVVKQHPSCASHFRTQNRKIMKSMPMLYPMSRTTCLHRTKGKEKKGARTPTNQTMKISRSNVGGKDVRISSKAGMQWWFMWQVFIG